MGTKNGCFWHAGPLQADLQVLDSAKMLPLHRAVCASQALGTSLELMMSKGNDDGIFTWYIWGWVKTLHPCSSHQNSWDWWMFIPLKMVLIVDFPIEKGGSFHSYVSLPEGISLLKSYFHRYWSIAIYLLLPSQSWDVFGLTWLQFRLLSTWGWCHATWRH